MYSTDETFARRWLRRVLTYTLVYASLLLLILSLPVWLPVALIVDAVRKTSWSATRAFCFVGWYLIGQSWGLIGCFLIWLFSGVWAGSRNHRSGRNHRLGMGRQRFIDWMFWIEFAWVRFLGDGAVWIWGMRPEIEFAYEFGERPVILLVRHASIIDTLIPLLYVCAPLNLRLRYVMKRELEWDPCIDLTVNRLPHLFVRRGSGDARKEIRAIGKLVEDVGPREGVVIFPEGTRYSEEKKARILKRLEDSGQDEILEWARGYQRVLPPRMGGPLALLKSNPGADVVFCAHTGLEKAASFKESFNGGFVGAVVYMRFWGVAFEDIPEGDDARQKWLLEEWKKVDEFILAHDQLKKDAVEEVE